MSNLAQLELQALLNRPRGPRLVLGVAMRILFAAVLFALCWWALSSCVANLTEPHGVLRVSNCQDNDFARVKSETPVCSGTLTAAGSGHIVSTSAQTLGMKLQPGTTIAVRYDGRGQDLVPDTSAVTWLAARDGLISVSLVTGGVLALFNAWRRIRPDLPWFRPRSKQWGRVIGIGSAVAVFSALASLVCALIAFI